MDTRFLNHRRFSMKKVLFVLAVLFMLSAITAQAGDVINGKGDESGASFSTGYDPVKPQVFGDFGDYKFRSNGGGYEKSKSEYNFAFIGFSYINPLSEQYEYITVPGRDGEISTEFSKDRKFASLVFDACNYQDYCAQVEVTLLGYGDLINEPYISESAYGCWSYRFQSVSPYRMATGVVSYTLLNPLGEVVFEESQSMTSGQIFRGKYTTHEMEIPDCE